MKSTDEASLARWMRRHHGVITMDEAAQLGISYRALLELASKGRLRRVYRGVYAETPSRTSPALVSSAAALAAAGPAAALSHRSAAWAWGLIPRPPGRVDLLLPVGARAALPGAQIHRTARPFGVRSHQDLRVTDPVRTTIDLAAVAPEQLAGAVDRGLAEGLMHIGQLESATRASADRRHRGVAILRHHLHERGHLGAPQPSVLESLMTRTVFRRYRLPLPEVEVVAGWFGQYRLDFAYRPIMLAVEVDGYVWHSSREHMEADNTRRNHLKTLGWQVLVYTWLKVTQEPEVVAAEILTNYQRLTAA